MKIFDIIFLLIVATTLAFGGEIRTWTGSNGKALDAEFVDHSNGTVSLRLEKGKVIKTKLASLSSGDQQYVTNLIKEKESQVNISELHGKSPAELKKWFPTISDVKPEGSSEHHNFGPWEKVFLAFNAKTKLRNITLVPPSPMSEEDARKAINKHGITSLPKKYENRALIGVMYDKMQGKIRLVNFVFVDWKKPDKRIKDIRIGFNLGWDE